MDSNNNGLQASAPSDNDKLLTISKGVSNISIEEEVARSELDSSEIKLLEKIGKGSYGVVYKGRLRGKEVAVKKLYESKLDENTMDSFKKEVAIMSKLRHPNVLLFMGACTEPGNLLIVTELMPKGSVYDLLHNDKNQIPFQRKMKIAKDAAMGMNWLHLSTPVFIHRDLKTGNLLVDQNWNVKVSDFGLSHFKQQRQEKGNYGAIGTPLWMAPEVLLNKEYNESADVYSFGIVLWELLTQEEPFPDIETFEDMIERVCMQHERPPIPEDAPPTLKKLIAKCWSPYPEERPTFEQIIPLFDIIVIEYLIHDEHGKKLWEKHFLGQESVPWAKFVKGFCTFWNVPYDPKSTKFLCLKEMCVDDKEEQLVSIEAFSKTLDWFGPMQDGIGLLVKIEDLLKQPYFHGDLGAPESETMLVTKAVGTFLARFSARDPGCYAISTLGEGNKVKHYRVYHKPGLKFMIGKTEVNSIQEIVTKYSTELGLKDPCPGSPYEKIFQKQAPQISEGYQIPEFS
eukprot:CAMPEP_0168567218 /NCGR_PEP_ID=MMETSP0413-20121227/14878_1 /TAXON_ID=136452 /ORGANISM="Filamoeba nolandi, Strain NC-AS-23-1" /LENGTH=511 /DNA_ID=CAMNT_0008599375 /DNA_START=169 /DNA_END=1704 /DNA_ORIENTATION=+